MDDTSVRRSRTRSAMLFAVPVVLTLTGCIGPGAPTPASTVTVTPTASAAAPEGADGGLDPIADVDAEVIEHADNRYLVVTLPLNDFDISIDWDPGDPGTMLRDALADDPTAAVATNAGIFTEQLVPGGLLVSDGEELVPVNLNEGGGNFHLMPNAVFAVYGDTAAVMDSRDYVPDGVLQATQSGPALILDGDIHPDFNEGSTNLAVRSGVGVSPDGETVYLAISRSLTNFWDFATLYRDELGVDDALYLDGDISSLWVTGMDEPGPLDGPYSGIITAHQK
ncbi:phosphodiester glycosidase family protein [Demequina flava]|uniref:phosphodiester glycosidase family protein n=1 Tax=Demequina flava TaxID=1095025 RepID=UPI00128AE022|nr:phosphodiester glycosidase family protein [Demequina flava]